MITSSIPRREPSQCRLHVIAAVYIKRTRANVVIVVAIVVIFGVVIKNRIRSPRGISFLVLNGLPWLIRNLDIVEAILPNRLQCIPIYNIIVS